MTYVKSYIKCAKYLKIIFGTKVNIANNTAGIAPKLKKSFQSKCTENFVYEDITEGSNMQYNHKSHENSSKAKCTGKTLNKNVLRPEAKI